MNEGRCSLYILRRMMAGWKMGCCDVVFLGRAGCICMYVQLVNNSLWDSLIQVCISLVFVV